MSEFFKSKRKTADDGNDVLVGTHVSANTSEYINLFCASDGTSKSEVFRTILEDWVKEAKEQYPEEKLEQMVAERGWLGWRERKRKTISFDRVLDKQKSILTKKKINKKTIRNILRKIKDIRNAKS